MNKRPWMPLYVADYLKDTTHLGALLSGAYLHLIMHYWTHGGLPDDTQQLSRIARLTAREWSKSHDTLKAFFHDGWKHKRLDAELGQAVEISKSNSEKARDAANKRWAKQYEPPMPEAMLQAAAKHPPSNTPLCTLHTSHFTEVSKKDSPAPLASLAGRPPTIPDTPVPDAKPKAPPRVVVNNGPERPKRRKVPIPLDWKPNDAHRTLCALEGHDPDDIEAHFRDVCKSNGYVYADHDAGFRNFIRNQKNFQRGTNGVRQNGSPLRGSILHAADLAIANLEREESRLRREIEAENQMRETTVPELPEH